jgi:hypothetical protein
MDYKSLWEMDDPDSEGYQAANDSSALEEEMCVLSTDDDEGAPSAKEESKLFDLIGKIDLKILQGECVYIQVNGLAYKVLYGVYWRSIHSGTKYWGFRCEQIERGMWSAEETATSQVDIPICYTNDGWVVEEQSLNFLLYRDMPLFDSLLSSAR